MNHLYLSAHPDDLEVMFGYHSLQATEPYALVATDGTAGVDLIDPVRRSFCRQWRAA